MKRASLVSLGLVSLVMISAGMKRWPGIWMGRQPDGSFLVSTGQRIEGGSIAFTGRPIDLALHPTLDIFAVLNKSSVFLASTAGVMTGTETALKTGAGFRGLVWTPDGQWLLASTEQGHIQVFRFDGSTLCIARKITITPPDLSANPVPGGMAITRDGTRLFVVAANRNAVVEVDLKEWQRVKEYPVENLPFEPRLSDDEGTLIVSNWGGRLPRRVSEPPRASTSTSWSTSKAFQRREA